MQDRLYEILTRRDEVTWQSIIQDLVKTEELDPWNVDVTVLAGRYRKALETMKEHNFFISGKMVLALAFLLKIKSDKLLNEYIADFDNVLFQKDEEDLFEDAEFVENPLANEQIPQLLIKTPQPRKRQLTLNDLMNALESALEVDVRRTVKRIQDDKVIQEAVIPEKKIDITALIHDVYDKVKEFFSTKDRIMFDDLLTNNPNRHEKIYTFIPLLHLDGQQKLNLEQEEAFGKITINKYREIKED